MKWWEGLMRVYCVASENISIPPTWSEMGVTQGVGCGEAGWGGVR